MLKTIIETQQLGFILFFSVYGIDAIVTIMIRLLKRENIFEAHRSHLYQYLANENGYSHVLIALIYALIQLIINTVVIYLNNSGYLTIATTVIILTTLLVAYLIIRLPLTRKIKIS